MIASARNRWCRTDRVRLNAADGAQVFPTPPNTDAPFAFSHMDMAGHAQSCGLGTVPL